MDMQSKISIFFMDLNKAYREGHPYFECYVSDWDDKEFLSLYRCLKYKYKLKTDIKVRRMGNSDYVHEYFYVDLVKTTRDKSEGFKFINVDKEVDEMSLKNKIPAISQIEGNVVYVDFSKKVSKK